MGSMLCQGPRSARTTRRVLLMTALLAPAACADEVSPARRSTHALASAARTVLLQNGVDSYAGSADTVLSQSRPTTAGGTATTLSVDGDEPSGSGQDTAILLRWDVSSIPPGSVVQQVSLAVRVTDPSSNSYPIMALQRAWTESSATWAVAQAGLAWEVAGAQGGSDRAPTALASLTATATGPSQVNWNAPGVAAVQRWVDAPAQNFGIILASAGNANGLDIASREHATVSARPALSVTYLPAAGPAPGEADAAIETPGTGGAPGSGGSASGGAPVVASGGASGSVDAAADLAPPSGGEPVDAPLPGLPAPAVLFAVGDVGDCNTTADTETAKLLDGSTDPIALLGDIGYPNGSASDLANCFGQPWGRHKSRVRPAPGNHEYLTSGASAYFQYFGAAAGTAGKGYYSYQVGSWHVVALNSNCTKVSCGAGSAQEQWLRQDLAAHPAACTLAYWHHPRYNSGHHGNATNMTALWKALMDFGADVVLTGHEHGYQRWKPMNESNVQLASGITEFIVGTGGTDLVAFSGSKPANVVVRDASTPGVLRLTLRPDGYDWRFLPIAGKTFSDQGSAGCH